MSTQVTKDGLGGGVDEWRSLMHIALDTARSRMNWPLLKHDYSYLFDHVDVKFREQLKGEFRTMQNQLRELQDEFKTWGDDYAYDWLIPMPEDLDACASY